jgi:hypothetical protein
MRFALIALAVVLGVLGILMVVAAGAGNAVPRIAVGAVLLIAAAVVGWIGRPSAIEVHQTVHQTVELSGDVRPQEMVCKQCGAPVPADSVKVRAGGIFVTCSHCGAEYQLEEAPKW